jgi:hypothetical protein
MCPLYCCVFVFVCFTCVPCIVVCVYLFHMCPLYCCLCLFKMCPLYCCLCLFVSHVSLVLLFACVCLFHMCLFIVVCLCLFHMCPLCCCLCLFHTCPLYCFGFCLFVSHVSSQLFFVVFSVVLFLLLVPWLLDHHINKHEINLN